jgi:hypothetical protein
MPVEKAAELVYSLTFDQLALLDQMLQSLEQTPPQSQPSQD